MRRVRPFRPEPVRGPVQRAEKRARRDGRIGGTQRRAPDAVGDESGDLLRRLRSFRTEPVRRPVQRAEERARSDGGVGGAQHAAPDAGGHERANAALVAIALGDDRCAQPAGEGTDLEVRGGAFDLVDQTHHVRDRETAEAIEQRTVVAPRVGERGQQPVGGDGDVAHAGGGEAPRAEHAGGGAHDLHAARVGAF